MADSSCDSRGVLQHNAADRRVHQRTEITPRLYVILHGSNTDGVLYDVSEGGAALEIVGPTPEGESLLVEFEMPETGQRFEAPACISWRDESRKKIGIHFLDLPEVSRTRMRDWLKTKSTPVEPGQSAIVQDADREAAAVALSRVDASEPPSEPIVSPGTPQAEVAIEERIASESQPVAVDEQPGAPANGRLVQSLLDSFNKPRKNPTAIIPDLPAQIWFSGWHIRGSILAVIAIFAAVLLALGVAARRSPDRKAKPFSVSKTGRLPIEEASAGQGDESGSRPDNTVSGGDNGGGDNSSGGSGLNIQEGSRLPAPALLSSLDASLPKSNRPPCVNLRFPDAEIRIFLWTEKGTPEVIAAAYARYLRAISDLRVVDKAPYDLVLYINGASVRAQGPDAGFMWSSRIFRPWYCGQSLGLLEQPQVNESLHYVQNPNLNLHIQSEVAFLILHALEGIRREQTR